MDTEEEDKYCAPDFYVKEGGNRPELLTGLGELHHPYPPEARAAAVQALLQYVAFLSKNDSLFHRIVAVRTSL